MNESEYKKLTESYHGVANLYHLLTCIGEIGGATEEVLATRLKVSKENIRGKLVVSSNWGLLSREGDT